MKVIQHNTPFNRSLPEDEISSNLSSFLELSNKMFSFDEAHIYHLTNENVNDYKSVIMKAFGNRIRILHNIGPFDNQDYAIKSTQDYFDSIIDANIFPKSLIVFNHVYGSTVESSFVFFEEHNDILMIDDKFSTLEMGKASYYRISTSDSLYASPIVASLGYESSTTNGIFPFVSFLLPVNAEKNHFEQHRSDVPHKKAEFQIRELVSGQDKFQKLTIPSDFKMSRHFERPMILNTRLIYNNEVIFNDYDIIDRDPQKIVTEKLIPFINDFKSQYEIIDNVPLKMTAEYYKHFKDNIWPVIEMAKV